MKINMLHFRGKTLGMGGFCLLAIALLFQNFTQNPDLANKYQISYTEKITRFTNVNPNDFSRLTELDKNKLRVIEELRQVVKTVDANNDLTTTTTITSTNEYESWVNRAAKIVSDKNGTTVYDLRNQVLASMPKSAIGVQQYQAVKGKVGELGLKPAPDFPVLSDAQLADFTRQGGAVSRLQNGQIKLTSGNNETIYDATNKIFTVSVKEQGRTVRQALYNYDVVGGQTVPSLKMEKLFETLPSGVCVENVTSTQYSNYSFTTTIPR